VKAQARQSQCGVEWIQKKIAKLEAKKLPVEQYININSNNNNNHSNAGVNAVPVSFQSNAPTFSVAPPAFASAPIIQSSSPIRPTNNIASPTVYYPVINSVGSHYVELTAR
jgi:hypothetical protein